MEKDILQKIEVDFGENTAKATKLLTESYQKNGFSPRVTRCIIHLSKGNIELLKENIKYAEADWRDVILWAETKEFEFNKPFNLV